MKRACAFLAVIFVMLFSTSAFAENIKEVDTPLNILKLQKANDKQTLEEIKSVLDKEVKKAEERLNNKAEQGGTKIYDNVEQKETRDRKEEDADKDFREGTIGEIPADRVSGFSIENAYKVYILDNLMIKKYNEGKSFSELITDQYQWKVPLVNQNGEKGLASLTERSDGIKLVGKSFGGKQSIIPADIETLSKTISDNIAEHVKSIKYVLSHRYYTTFVYVETANDEYLIPFAGNPELIGLTSGKAYTVNDIFRTFNEHFNEDISPEEGLNNSGMPFKDNGNSARPASYLFPIIILSVIGIGVGILLLRKAKYSLH